MDMNTVRNLVFILLAIGIIIYALVILASSFLALRKIMKNYRNRKEVRVKHAQENQEGI